MLNSENSQNLVGKWHGFQDVANILWRVVKQFWGTPGNFGGGGSFFCMVTKNSFVRNTHICRVNSLGMGGKTF